LAHNPAEFGEDRKPSDISPLIGANRLKLAVIWVKLAMIWILRKFAESWNGSGEAANAPLLTKQVDTFSTVELLFNISKSA
jgi:hypothetical protein